MWSPWPARWSILLGIVLTVLQLVVSIRNRDALRDRTGDPWNGRTLEWSIASPPPPWNFAVLPQVQGADAYWGMKQAGQRARRASPTTSRSTCRATARSAWRSPSSPRSAASRWSGTSGGWRSSASSASCVASLVHGWIVDREVHVPASEIAAFEQARHRGSAS